MDADVIIVGAGPVGLLLAAEVQLGGGNAVVLERLTEPSRDRKARGIGPLATEALRRRGLGPHLSAADPDGARDFTRDHGTELGHFANIHKLAPDPHRHGTRIWQPDLERLLTTHAESLGARILRGHDVVALESGTDSVTVLTHTSTGEHRLCARYLIGCDGAHSRVRKLTPFAFPGTPPLLRTIAGAVTFSGPAPASGRYPTGTFLHGGSLAGVTELAGSATVASAAPSGTTTPVTPASDGRPSTTPAAGGGLVTSAVSTGGGPSLTPTSAVAPAVPVGDTHPSATLAAGAGLITSATSTGDCPSAAPASAAAPVATVGDGRPSTLAADGGLAISGKSHDDGRPGAPVVLAGSTRFTPATVPSDAAPVTSANSAGEDRPAIPGTRADNRGPVTAAELAAAIHRVTGADVTIDDFREPRDFTDQARQADTYRHGRVLLAGDAAHVHSPSGGQGLNLGLLDAMNLGWKLAAVSRGAAPESLLDTYTRERHPAAAAVLHNTRAQSALLAPGPHVDALRDIVSELMEIPAVNRYFSALLSGVDHRYELPYPGTEPVGLHSPDLDLIDDHGVHSRLHEHLRSGRGLLLLTPETQPFANYATNRVEILPVTNIGPRLLRPDGVIAWAEGDSESLQLALDTWFPAS
ncbi:FAD-dependent monooxygenase [Amycolatopsis sp. NPDC051372]|uniref:FAD-dependent monooxygenase n=1 Tax=Amycolatopsis sp. NPDC051372 TaxID=3155669 RepID=UPI003425A677